jgi:hypothetical protein
MIALGREYLRNDREIVASDKVKRRSHMSR